ncbi:MAG: glutamate synthase-related protein [Candidatus Bathyarchaeia archaeon]|nr:IMP dehydrogenase [Candidatus Bathyarchaeota archaeon]
MSSFIPPEFIIKWNAKKCTRCLTCIKQCSFEVFSYIEENDAIISDNSKCVGCYRCVALCPAKALIVKKNSDVFKSNHYWTPDVIKNIYKQAESGGVLLTGMGCDKPYPIYWDHMLLNASQVTNPSIDPIREPIELKTYIGRKPDRLEFRDDDIELRTTIAPQLEVDTPILFAAMSYGAISINALKALAMAAEQVGTYCNTGEGGLPQDLYEYSKNIIVQVASGRFGVDLDYLSTGAAIEIKIGQGAKPGIGGHLPGEKVTEAISRTRKIPIGTDALSPAPHHDIYSIEDLKQLIDALKEATDYSKPVGVKIAAVHNSPAIASGVARAGADFIVIDGFRGGTGAAPLVIRDHVGIPLEFALAAVDDRLREEGIRNQISIIASGGIRCSADVAKAIALGADAVYIGTAALIAMGCHMCQKCYTGKCNWGIATQDPSLVERLNPKIAAKRLVNLLNAWTLELKEILGAMGMNSIESLRGNRLQLRGIGLSDKELEILGILPAGR